MSRLRHIAFCGGGSGGHLFPSIAVMQTLLQRPSDVRATFLTSARPIDERVLANAGLTSTSIEVVKQPIQSSRGKFALAQDLLRSFCICRGQFKKDRPEIVVGTGGFASIAGIIAAWWLKIPVVLLEVNAVPGRANRMLARFASVTCFGFDVAEQHLQTWRGEVQNVGVPVREHFSPTANSENGALRILVLGGSQGASAVNRLFTEALAMQQHWPEITLLHQAGESAVESLRQRYLARHQPVEVVSFIQDMASEIASADLIISRAGAVTISEICGVGRSVILIPLSTAADDHQSANAACLLNVGAALTIDETESDAANRLCEQITRLLKSRAARLKMQDAQRDFVKANAAVRVINVLGEVISHHSMSAQ